MSAEAHFQHLTYQVRNLLGCSTAALLLGCPESELRHPLLDLFPANPHHYIGCYGCSPDINTLLRNEQVRALCDLAIQTGQVQSTNQLQAHIASIAVAPLERPAGLLGFFLLANLEAFSHGELLLLSCYSHRAAQILEQDLSSLRKQRDEFISIVGHELRMPLTSIKGYAGLLQAYGIPETSMGEMTPARQRQYLTTIIEQADHLEVLISDLLDISRIQSGRLALRFTYVDAASLCQRVAELAQQRVEPEKYSIRCLPDPELPLVWADPDRLQQVLTNLLENAIKYSPSGGTIEVLAYTSRQEPRTMHITVSDQGIGISYQQQSRLFKPFSRLEHSATDQVPGAGLGLYITRKLVEAMGGNLALDSSEGVGTSVTFTLPLVSNEVSPPEPTLATRP